MPRKPNTEQRRKEIVDGLLAAIAEHGYEKATVQAIARKAGLAPGLVHYHFRDKEEILLELVRSLAGLAQQRYERLAAAAASPDERLRAYIDARLARDGDAQPQAVAAWVIIGAEAVRQPQVRALYQGYIEAELRLLEELLAACLAARSRQAGNAARLAASLVAFMEGAFQLASAARDAMPQGYAADMARELILRFLDAEPPV